MNSQVGKLCLSSVISIIAALTTHASTTNCTPHPLGLAGWWQAEGNAKDAIGTNAGILRNGVNFSTGAVGQAFDLDGTSSFVEIADAPELHLTNMTVEAWIYPRSAGGGVNSAIVLKWDGGGNERSFGFALGIYGELYLILSSTGADVSPQASTPIIPINIWTHVAGTYDGAAIRTYVNGTMVSTVPWTNGIHAGTAPLVIGKALISGALFNGLIDEPSLYSRALSESEIQAIFNVGAAGKCPWLNPAGLSLSFTPTLTITGAIGQSFNIQYANSVNETNSWTPLTNLTLIYPVQRWFDTTVDFSSGAFPRRFYRVIPIP